MEQIFFISSCHPTAADGGIYTCKLSETGEPEILHHTPLPSSGYLAFDAEKKILYAACGIDDTTNGVAAFTINSDASLSLLGEIQPTGGRSSCHVTVSANRKFLYTANYLSGSFTEFCLAPDGSIAPGTRIIHHHGCGPNKARQEMPHPHCCVFSPDGRFLAVPDLGNDTVFCYPFDENDGIAENSPVINHLEAGCGPRHILFDPEKSFAYVIAELGNTLYSFQWDNGKLLPIEELFLLPRGASMPSKAAALRFSDTLDFMVCSNRGFDSLATVELDGHGGIFPAALTLSGGSSPRDVNFIGTNFFAAANEFSDEVRFFDFDNSSGILSPNGYVLNMPRPSAI